MILDDELYRKLIKIHSHFHRNGLGVLSRHPGPPDTQNRVVKPNDYIAL